MTYGAVKGEEQAPTMVTKQEALEEIERCNEQLLWHARHQNIVRPEVVALVEQRRDVAEQALAEAS